MSKWRVKGYVQDSDEEDDDDIEKCCTSTNRDSQRAVDVPAGRTTGGDDVKEQPARDLRELWSVRDEYFDDGPMSNCSRSKDERQATQLAEDRFQSLSVTPPIYPTTKPSIREPTGSPDPLQPTPKADRTSKLLLSSQILGVPDNSQVTGEAEGARSSDAQVDDALLAEFGLAPLSDPSESELSDPPTDLDEPCMHEKIFTSPMRRTTAQVVIPSSTAAQQQTFERHVERSLRERKPIQLHPYLLEGERYRRDLQGRGVKPITRAISPPRRATHKDQESQEQDFNPDEDHAPNSSPEIPVSTPTVRRRAVNEFGSSNRRTHFRSHNLVPCAADRNGAKRRRLNQPLHNTTLSRQGSITEHELSRDDIWMIPQSPPESSSPPVNRSGSTIRQPAKFATITPVPDLPTPSNSSSLPAQPDDDSDVEPILPSVQQLGQGKHRTIVILSDGSLSDSEASETRTQTQASDNELRRVGKKIKGVLPASWLRLDQQAQAKRKKHMRDRLNTFHSPEKAEPQRGVAQRVDKRKERPLRPEASNYLGQDATDISEDSDGVSHSHATHVENLQESARLASETAAMLDRRYADHDSDTMENDRLHLFTLGGPSRKRKVQSRLTDAFKKSKKSKVSADSKATTVSRNLSKRYMTSHKTQRTPLPALSVLDFDQSPSNREKAIPPFLKIARRQARRRSDYARQEPTNKHIRLHTARDTEDANVILQQWRRGDMKARTNIGLFSKEPEPRTPLLDLDQNRRRSRLSSSLGIDDAISRLNEHLLPMTQSPRPPARRMLPSGLMYIRQKVPPRADHTNYHSGVSSSRSKSLHSKNKKGFPYRTAQLEALETDHGGADRRIAFERGLQRVDRQFDLQLPLTHISRNPQMARFLADDDAVPSPLSSVEDVGEQTPETPTQNLPAPRRRLTRKVQAKRVDIETREFRQPSEPVADDFLTALSSVQFSNSEQDKGGDACLHGLGPYGTRYSTTFDISPLQDGTYFHVSTLVGSGVLHRALPVAEGSARNLDENAGFCTVDLVETSMRCGPWDDSTFARIADSANNVCSSLTDQTWNDDLLPGQESPLSTSSRIIRSLIDYVSTHLSFHDPIDRRSFAIRMDQIAASFFDHVMSNSPVDTSLALPAKTNPHRVKSLAYLLVLSTQIYRIAQDSKLERSICSNLATLVVKISKSLVADLVHHISHLSDFLEDNKRYKVRENGIRESDVIVESVVICMHVLSETNIPGATFWELVGQHLLSRAQKAVQLAELESIWSIVFTLLPFIEFNDLGIPMRTRRTSFEQDNWVVIRALVQRLFTLYPETSKAHNASLDDYVRATLTRCHHLIHFWNWKRCEAVLYAMFDFFVAKNGLKHLPREQCNGSMPFLEHTDSRSCLLIDPNEKSFHIFLKCLFIGLQGMQCHTEKKLRSVVLRLTPNHGRRHPKDQPLDADSLEALTNHHDILCILYKAAPPSCRPKLELIKNLVRHESSHREACRVSVRAWANLAAFQLSIEEPYTSVQPFAEWHKEIMKQTLRQYFLAKTEADEYLSSHVFNNSEAASLMVRQTVEKNQEQVIATLRDCIAGMLKAIGVRSSQVSLKRFLVDSDFVHLLELRHLQDSRLIVVIRDALGVLRAFASVPCQPLSSDNISEQNEESQDYGEPLELDDLELDGFVEMDQEILPSDDFQTPLWRLLSNAFGAESAPEDNLLMDCIDTWCLIARSQVSSGARSWSFYLDPFSQVAWQQLRRTEQAQKFRPYFMASLLDCDPVAYTQHRLVFLNALMASLADRESMLRFQHRLLSAIVRASPKEPLMRNLPFFDNGTSSSDITADTVRTRRLALISTILSNMREDFHDTIHEDPGRAAELRGNYAAILQDFMNAMKNNYQQLGSGTTVTGAYVEFVQKVVQFLQQYTADIHPILDFFTNSVAFPLPAADPTYVVGRLCGYATKLAKMGIAKQLSVFVQIVAQQATTGGHQPYLVHQLQTALCSDEAPTRDRIMLRDVLLQGIFPAYIDTAFTSPIGFIIAKPIMQSLVPTVGAMLFDIRVFDEVNVRAVCDCLLSLSHAFIRSTEQLIENGDLLKQPHVLTCLSLMFQALIPISSLLDYICGRCSESSITPLIITYFEQFSASVSKLLYDKIPQTVPSYSGDSSVGQSKYCELLSFSVDGLKSGIKANWSSNGDCIYFGQGHAKREVLFDQDSAEAEKANLIQAIEAFLVSASVYREDPRYEERLERQDLLGGIDV
ncbi:hypothetical protein N0V90_005756 [Kalmusia sp. IMI 367209]|nr:hypothetical protein N0V90_005756 [Kalmusia sp. IMI 367209]